MIVSSGGAMRDIGPPWRCFAAPHMVGGGEPIGMYAPESGQSRVIYRAIWSGGGKS